MSTETVWVCDKCGVRGSQKEVSGQVNLKDITLNIEFTYLDLCTSCMDKVAKYIHDFMNPKREYPKKIEKLVPESGPRIETTIIKKA